MPAQSTVPWQLVFFAGAALLVAVQAWRGWRLGVVRQIVEILSVAAAYATAYLAGPLFAPMLRPLGLPDQVLTAIAGGLAGFLVFVFIRISGAILFKRTAQQSIGIIRFCFGASGALVGAVFGLFLVWVITMAIRVCGSLAETRVKNGEMAQAAGRAVFRAAVAPVGEPTWIRDLVHLKQAIEDGAAGGMVKQMDPLPTVVYSTMGRIGVMLSNQDSVDRFLEYPGIQPLAQNPKIVALRDDPAIVRDVKNADYMSLLRNPHVVQAANDTEVLKLLRKLDVQKALDYALGAGEKPHLLPSR